MDRNRKPTKEELQAAAGKFVPDLIAHGLKVLFCGINPGLYSAAVNKHFARPGNRFWPALYSSGFINVPLNAYQEFELLKAGLGITNLVKRATASASELSRTELEEGRKELEKKVKKYSPQMVAILGITAYRTAFNKPEAIYGLQKEKVADAWLWVLPNPSGLNAHFKPADLSESFRKLYTAVQQLNNLKL